MKLKKYKKSTRNIKWIKLSVLVFLFFGIAFAALESNLSIIGNILVTAPQCDVNNKLYNVLKCEAITRGLAREYIGDHQDSMNASLSTEKIYHWYANNDLQGSAINNKNNVIFANHCWQIIRTTDTGGVKLIYNGEAENNQCLDTRGSHAGYSGKGQLSFDNNDYYFGTDYTYDSSTQKFTLAGNITRVTNHNTYWNDMVGKYTCRNEDDPAATCSYLIMPVNLNIRNLAITIKLNTTTRSRNFGDIAYDDELATYYPSIAKVGYMYDYDYSLGTIGATTYSIYSYTNIDSNYYYSDSYDYNETNTNKYTLTNPTLITDPADLIGKYTFTNTSPTYSSYSIYYVVGVQDNKIYYLQLSSGRDLSYYNNYYTYGESYTDNGNGTYTINNPTTIQMTDYNSVVNDLYNKYVCINTTSSTCSEMNRVVETSDTSFRTFNSGNSSFFGNNFNYNSSTGKYALTGTVYRIWDYNDPNNMEIIKNNRYICAYYSDSNQCTEIGYVDEIVTGAIQFAKLKNGDGISEYLEGTRTNVNDSIVKVAVDSWYKHYLYNSYDSYIEDTIYCNDREIPDLKGWDINGDSLDGGVYFRKYNLDTDLSCIRTKDKFSTQNNQAKLTYKVGLPTGPEMNLLGNANARTIGKQYWTMTPHSTNTDVDNFLVSVKSDGNMDYYDASGDTGLRPVISLKPNTSFTTGNGSMENPYVVN